MSGHESEGPRPAGPPGWAIAVVLPLLGVIGLLSGLLLRSLADESIRQTTPVVVLEPGRAIHGLTSQLVPVVDPVLDPLAPPDDAASDTRPPRVLRVIIDNQSDRELKKLLVVATPRLVGSGLLGTPVGPSAALSVTASGRAVGEVVSERGGRSRLAVYRVSFPATSRSEVMLSVQRASDGPPVPIIAELWNPRALDRFDHAVSIFVGALLGALAIVAAWAVGRGILLRARGPTVLAAYCASALVFEIAAHGLLGAFFGLDPAIEGVVRLVSISGLVIAGLALMQFSLAVPGDRWLPWGALALQGLAVVAAVSAGFGLPFSSVAARFLVLLSLAFACYLVFTRRLAAPMQDVLKGGLALLSLVVATAAFAAVAPVGGFAPYIEPFIHGGFAVAAIMAATAFAVAAPGTVPGKLQLGRLPAPLARLTHRSSERLRRLLPATAPAPGPGAEEAATPGSHGGTSFLDLNRYELGIAAAHQGLWDWDAVRRQLYLSPSVDQMLGLDPGDLDRSPEAWVERIHPEDRPSYVEAMRTYLERGNVSFSIEFRLRHEHGGFPWFQLRGTCLPGEDGRAARCVGVISDITPTKTIEERLAEASKLDAVTGLPSRGHLLRIVNHAVTGWHGRTGPRPMLLMIDIDRFKDVNDSFGPRLGDVLLYAFGRRLEKIAAEGECVARIGSDEFALFIPNADAMLSNGSQLSDADALTVLETVRKDLFQPIELGGEEVVPTVSIGAAFARDDHVSGEDLFKDAGLALAEAKSRGGGQAHLFEPAMRKPRIGSTLSLETELRRSLDRQQIRVLYQPICRVSDGALRGFEALVRWDHPVQGLLSPDEFLPVAEASDLIVPIGRYVLSLSAFQLARWQRTLEGAQDLSISVNISGRQLRRADFVRDVEGVIEAARPRPGALHLEVTESLVLDNPAQARSILEEVRTLGVGLSLDDFGTGFASLSNLQQLPFDTLKIDRSFVTSMLEKPDSRIIVQTIVGLARDLGLNLVAEGAETDAHVAALREMGCPLAQGYRFGRPMDAMEAAALIKASAAASA